MAGRLQKIRIAREVTAAHQLAGYVDDQGVVLHHFEELPGSGVFVRRVGLAGERQKIVGRLPIQHADADRGADGGERTVLGGEEGPAVAAIIGRRPRVQLFAGRALRQIVDDPQIGPPARGESGAQHRAQFGQRLRRHRIIPGYAIECRQPDVQGGGDGAQRDADRIDPVLAASAGLQPEHAARIERGITPGIFGRQH
jgi:hypothetical protein